MRRLARILSVLLGAVLSLAWLALALACGLVVVARPSRTRWRRLHRTWLDWSPWWLWRRLAPAEAAVETPRRRMGRAKRERIFRQLLVIDGPWCQVCLGHRGPLLLDAHHHHELAPEVHHVVPFVDGGPCDITNAVLAHRICNQKTGATVLPHLLDHLDRRHQEAA